MDLSGEIDPSVCQNCGEPVSELFRRVEGDNDDVAHRCNECDSWRRTSRGSAAGVDVEHADPETTVGHHGNAVVTDGGRSR